MYAKCMHTYVDMYNFTVTCGFAHLVNRTIEDLYSELVREGIIVKYPKTRLSEYIGEFRYY